MVMVVVVVVVKEGWEEGQGREETMHLKGSRSAVMALVKPDIKEEEQTSAGVLLRTNVHWPVLALQHKP